MIKVSLFRYEANIRGKNPKWIGKFNLPAKPNKGDILFHKDDKFIIDKVLFDCDCDYIEVMLYRIGIREND